MSEFSLLAKAVVSAVVVEPTAALALADYLSERGDERGTRLRRRVKRYEKDIAKVEAFGRYLEDPKVIAGKPHLEGVQKQVIRSQAEWRRGQIENLSRTLVSYVFRLTSVGSGEKTPPETVGGSYILVEPKE